MVATSGPWGRLAPSLVTMVNEADRIAPNRRRTSDGSLGDTAHAARASFHNPQGGYVDALDLSHDPANGFDAHKRARAVVARKDVRLDHVISNRQIWSVARPYWRAYTGSNPHTMHAHFAVKRNTTGRKPTGLWWPATSPPKPSVPVSEEGMSVIIKGDASPQWWVTNGVQKNAITQATAAVLHIIGAAEFGPNGQPHVVAQAAVNDIVTV